MSRTGFDYSAGRPSGAQIRAAGGSFVARYLSAVNPAKCITATEAADLRAHGVDIACVYEDGASTALGGYSTGQQHARHADTQARAAGAPADHVVYFAADFDATPSQSAVVGSYIRGAASVLGHDRVGIYGGFWVVSRVLDAGLCRYAWQTVAWSGGRWDPRAQLRQYAITKTIGGVSCDVDEAMVDDFGQWDRPMAPEEDIVASLDDLKAALVAERQQTVQAVLDAPIVNPGTKVVRHLGELVMGAQGFAYSASVGVASVAGRLAALEAVVGQLAAAGGLDQATLSALVDQGAQQVVDELAQRMQGAA